MADNNRLTGNFAFTPRYGYQSRPVDERTGENAVKIPLPVINLANPQQSIIAQAGACAVCKDATCSSLGCSMGKNIGDANKAIAKAGEVITNAFEVLKRNSPDKAGEFVHFCAAMNPAETPDYAALEEALFSRLRAVDPAAAERFEKQFQGFMRESYEIFREGGGRGDIYGLACPSESLLCGAYCQLEMAMGRGVTIAMNEASVFNYAWQKNWVTPVTPAIERAQSIAIVGSGATGTHAALEARKRGYQVTVFERNELPGELGDGKIHPYKVPIEIWQRDWEWQKASGITFRLGTPIAPGSVTLAELAGQFNAIVLATGTPRPRPHGLQGDAQKDVIYSNDYLQHQQRQIYRKRFLGQEQNRIPPEFHAGGRHVLINGHGDTAVDCARVAIAQGAESVRFISRHDKINALSSDYKAYAELVKEAGAKLLEPVYHMSAVEVNYGDNQLVLLGANGQKLEANMIISAIGNITGNLREQFGIANLPVTKAGTVDIQLPALSRKSAQNGVIGGFVGRLNGTPVFAGGEVVSGSSLLVTAGKAGIDLGPMIHEYMGNPDAFYERAERASGHPVLDLHPF